MCVAPNCKVFYVKFFYAHRYHEEEGPTKLLATLEIISYIQCGGSLKT